MIYRQKKTSYIVLAFLILIVLFVIVSNFISVPMQIKTYSEVFPKEKWILTRGTGSQIISHVIDFKNGHTTKYDISQFERGEFVSAKFSESSIGKKRFAAGDTIYNISSSNVLDQLIEAEGELEIAAASLQSGITGEKEPLIQEAEARLSHTDERISEQKILYERAKQIFEKGLSSKAEYELQKWTLDLLQLERKAIIAQIDNLRTGVKPTEAKLLKSKLDAAGKKLQFLKNRESHLIITAPIGGEKITSLSPDTLLYVLNYDEVIVHMPVKVDDYAEFSVGQMLTISFAGSEYSLTAEVITIDKEVQIINSEQVFFVSLLMENKSYQLIPGMIKESVINLRQITLFDQIIKFFTD